MSEVLSLAEIRARLEEAYANPNTLPEENSDAAWELLLDISYDGEPSEERTALLPWAEALLQRNASNRELRADHSNYYLNSRIALGCWGVFASLARNESVNRNTRDTSIRSLGAFVKQQTKGTFDLSQLDVGPARKCREATTLGLLLHNPESSGIFGVPAPPFTHEDYRDGRGQKATFQINAFSPDNRTPIHVAGMYQPRLRDICGSLVVILGRPLMSASKGVEGMVEESKKQGNITDGERWLINLAGELLADKHRKDDPKSAYNRDGADKNRRAKFLAFAANQLRKMVTDFDPLAPPIISDTTYARRDHTSSSQGYDE